MLVNNEILYWCFPTILNRIKGITAVSTTYRAHYSRRVKENTRPRINEYKYRAWVLRITLNPNDKGMASIMRPTVLNKSTGNPNDYAIFSILIINISDPNSY